MHELDLSKIPPAARFDLGRDKTLYLYEVLCRIEITPEAERIKLNENSFDLVALMKEVALMIKLRAIEKGISVVMETEAIKLPFVKADLGKVRQILINLLGNAVKYTDEGSVTVRGYTEPIPEASTRCQIVIEVEDTGPGIDPTIQEVIFEPFVQYRDVPERRGTGLGLSICKRYAEFTNDKVRGFEAGGVDFITKPFQEEEVLARIRTHLMLRNMQRNLAKLVDERTAELANSEQLARTLINATTDVTHLIDEDGTILDLNDAMAKILGGKQEELIGTCVFDRFSPEAAEYRRNLIRQAVVERKHMRHTDRQTSGKVYDVGVYPIETSAGGKNLVVIFAHDVTERENALKALENSEARLKEAQRIARLGNWELDLLTDTLTWSEEVFRIFEMDPNDFGESYEAFLNAIHPDDRDRVNDAYKRSLKTRLPYGLDHRLLMPDGRIKYVREQCETVYSPEGKPLRSVGTVQDITTIKQADRERTQLRLELAHLNRVMQMNELSASFAHEINQPLGAILNNATAAQILTSRNEQRDDEIDEILGDIIQDANRIDQIVQRIRAAVKKEEPTFKPLNMNGLIKDVVASARKIFRKNHVSVILDLQPKLAQIRGDHIGLQQVLINLITNAIEAMRKSSSRNLEIGTTVPSPDKLIVSVGDSGMGIDETTEDKLFVPFFTTKKDGLGMGLRICRAIIEEHGGRIWVENNSNGGATFSFSLKANPGESK